MRNVLLTPWKGGTPRRLANNLGLFRRTPKEWEKDKDKHKVGLILNWGCSVVLPGAGPKIINPPSLVAGASNKLSCLRKLHDKLIPSLEYTLERSKAEEWLKTASVVGHHNLHAHSGQGLALFKKGTGITRDDCKLFTRYFPKKTECRVHCIQQADGKYRSFYLEKKRVKEERFEEFGLEETPQTYIRTWDNGWIFARNVSTNLEAVQLAAKTMAALGLAYGAVDIMFNEEKMVVGEVNTAPGLEGQCLSFYINNLHDMIERNRR